MTLLKTLSASLTSASAWVGLVKKIIEGEFSTNRSWKKSYREELSKKNYPKALPLLFVLSVYSKFREGLFVPILSPSANKTLPTSATSAAGVYTLQLPEYKNTGVHDLYFGNIKQCMSTWFKLGIVLYSGTTEVCNEVPENSYNYTLPQIAALKMP